MSQLTVHFWYSSFYICSIETLHNLLARHKIRAACVQNSIPWGPSVLQSSVLQWVLFSCSKDGLYTALLIVVSDSRTGCNRGRCYYIREAIPSCRYRVAIHKIVGRKHLATCYSAVLIGREICR